MNLTLEQTKLLGLTMELDVKALEYKKLCDELDNLKLNGVDENDEILLELKDKFKENHEAIVNLNRELSELKELDTNILETNEKECLQTENIEENNTQNIAIAVKKENVFSKVLLFFKNIFNKNK